MSAWLSLVTVVPGATVSVGGEKVKLSTLTSAVVTAAGVAACGDWARGPVGSASAPAASAGARDGVRHGGVLRRLQVCLESGTGGAGRPAGSAHERRVDDGEGVAAR